MAAGSRLQWLDKHRFIFNDFDPDNNQYIARIWDMAEKKEIATLTKPIQTLIDSDNFPSLNYQRLAKLRPDYGYFNLDANDYDLTDTEQDGIYKVNITTGEHQLVYALADIISHDSKNQMRRLNHKINHLMISPNGKKMLMLHRMFDGQRRFGRLLLGDVDGTKLVTLPGDDMISHYCWADDDTIICYMRTNEAGDGYYQIKLSENRAYLMKTISDVLLGDGHPSFAGHNQFITDTYPDRYGYQRLYHCNSETNKVTLASFYHPRRYSSVTRCDLHPRVSTDGLHCYFDTVTAGRRRLFTNCGKTLMFAKLQSYKWPLTVGFVLLILNGVWQLAGAPTYLIKGGYFVFLLFYCFVLLLQAKMKMAIDGLVQIYIICLFFVVMNLLYPFQTLSVSFFQLFQPYHLILSVDFFAW